VTALGGGAMPTETEQERAALEQTKTFRATGFGYFLEQATRPQTIGYALLDSPVALAAWMLDHDTDSYQKISRAFVDGQPAGNLTRDHVLDNISLYWLTGTGASAARAYWESGRAAARPRRPGRLLPGSRSRSASPPSPTRSSRPRAAGSSRPTQPGLLQPGRAGRPLRRLGRARAVLRGGPGRVPVPALRQPALGLDGDHLVHNHVNGKVHESGGDAARRMSFLRRSSRRRRAPPRFAT
jgi:hypothetical protein